MSLWSMINIIMKTHTLYFFWRCFSRYFVVYSSKRPTELSAKRAQAGRILSLCWVQDMQYYSFMIRRMKYWICVTFSFAFSIRTAEKCFHYLLFIQLSDSWFMIRLDLNISCRQCFLFPFHAWSTVMRVIVSQAEGSFISTYFIDVLMRFRYHSFDEKRNYFNGCFKTQSVWQMST